MKIAVTTPTGHIGSRVVDRLLEAGAEVVVLAREPERLTEAVRARTAVRHGTLEDAAFFAAATAGVDALFVLVPPDFRSDDLERFQLRIGRNAAAAVRANRIPRVVLLSSAGAHRDDLGPVSRLGEIERLLEAEAPNVLSIRAGYFMENLLPALDTVRGAGTVYGAAAPDTPVPFVATRDLGDAAASFLLDPSWSGHQVRGVHGPEDVTHARVAEILSAATDQPVSYVQVPQEATRAALLAAGASESVAETYAELFDGLARTGFPREPRAEVIAGTTSLEKWVAEVFVPALGVGTTV